MASAAVGLIGSATPISPAAFPSIATKTTVCPWRRSSWARSTQGCGVDAELVEMSGVADDDAPPVNDADHAAAGH